MDVFEGRRLIMYNQTFSCLQVKAKSFFWMSVIFLAQLLDIVHLKFLFYQNQEIS